MASIPQSTSKPKQRNVNVTVRVRPISDAEIASKARSITQVDEGKREINLRERAAAKTFGPFDRVYDNDCSQVRLYKEVVAPLVLQVLQGYNCTVFAYGQTGSGKTYTMEGHHDVSGEYTWENDPKAGVIPRALHHIFSKLETEKPEDYSVRASYLELYNEQVFDLLSGSDTSLRVFDNKEKGLIISGMEDVPVRDRTEVYALLRKGSERRKTACTLMNMSSSRSHSVFTVTVTTRQTIDSEELLRIGKINCVDLAGSENVSRSGAVDARAREAGNINTSLLALGRVITALTSNAQHIPFRESKLTRILQDSLGGKTITSIIATLSPASTNYEEIVSTLEYVQRAKNIRNTVEANACLSRKHVLLAYNEEIARLQRDLMAARMGAGGNASNGFYIDKENYEQLNAENSESKQRLEELEAELVTKLTELANLRDDLLFMDSEYARTFNDLRDRATRLQCRIRENEALKKQLGNLEQNHESALEALSSYEEVTKRLRERELKHKETAIILYDELASIHDKIENMRTMNIENDHLLGNFTAARIAAINKAKATTTAYVTESRLLRANERKETTSTSAITRQHIDALTAKGDNAIAQITSMEQNIDAQINAQRDEHRQFLAQTKETIVDAMSTLKSTHDALRAATLENQEQAGALGEQSDALHNTHTQHVEQSRRANEQRRSTMRQLYTTMSDCLQKLQSESETGAQDYSAFLDFGSMQTQKLSALVGLGTKLARQHAEKAQADNDASLQYANNATQKLAGAIDAHSSNVESRQLQENATRMAQAATSALDACKSTATQAVGAMSTGAKNVAQIVEKDSALIDNFASALDTQLSDEQQSIERFVHQDFVREARSGGTPERRTTNESQLLNCSPVPSKTQLLERHARAPLRASVYNTRDSLLNHPLPYSPQTLRNHLPSTVAAARKNSDDSADT